MDFKIHPFSEASVTSWSGGKTAQFFIFPPEAQFAERNFDFRISSATIETETSDFTPLPTYNRLLAVLEGEMEIRHEGKYVKHLSALDSDSFHGSWKTTSRGKVRDFNVIYSDQYNLDFRLVTTAQTEIIEKSSDFLFFLLLNDVLFQGKQLKRYDLLQVEAEAIELGKGMDLFEVRLSRIHDDIK